MSNITEVARIAEHVNIDQGNLASGISIVQLPLEFSVATEVYTA